MLILSLYYILSILLIIFRANITFYHTKQISSHFTVQCNSRIKSYPYKPFNKYTHLLSQAHVLIIISARTKVQHSAKSVQTSRVVCTNFSRSLYRLQLKFADYISQRALNTHIQELKNTQERYLFYFILIFI